LAATIEAIAQNMDGDEAGQEAYGKFAHVVVPFFRAARTKLRAWQVILANTRALINAVSQKDQISQREAKRLVDALRDASKEGLDLVGTEPEMGAAIETALMDFHIKGGGIGNSLQNELIRRVVACRNFREFDFTDLSCCLSFTDKDESPENAFFLTRAWAILAANELYDLRHALSLLETILFFLRYMDKEDLGLTYEQYRSKPIAACVSQYVDLAWQQYCPGKELVKTAGRNFMSEKDVLEVLEQLRTSSQEDGGNATIDGLKPIVFCGRR